MTTVMSNFPTVANKNHNSGVNPFECFKCFKCFVWGLALKESKLKYSSGRAEAYVEPCQISIIDLFGEKT